MSIEDLARAVTFIDGLFGNGYALEHPQLVAAYIQALSTERAGDNVADAIDGLSDRLESLRPDLRTDHPLQGETFDGLQAALSSLAEATQNIAAMLDLHSCGRSK